MVLLLKLWTHADRESIQLQSSTGKNLVSIGDKETLKRIESARAYILDKRREMDLGEWWDM